MWHGSNDCGITYRGGANPASPFLHFLDRDRTTRYDPSGITSAGPYRATEQGDWDTGGPPRKSQRRWKVPNAGWSPRTPEAIPIAHRSRRSVGAASSIPRQLAPPPMVIFCDRG